MDKILRNTIIITACWVLLLLAGIFFVYGHQKGSLSDLKKEVQMKSARLTELKSLQNDLSELQDYYQRLKEIHLRYKGTLASFVSPGETFDYIRRELEMTNSSIKLDMDFVSEQSFKNMMKRTYDLKGYGKFVDLYEFLWFLENGPVFYAISSLTISEIDASAASNDLLLNVDESAFNISIVGFDRSEGPKITEINRDFGQPMQIAELFKAPKLQKSKALEPEKTHYASRGSVSASPAVEKAQPKNDKGLPEISSKCQILAITPFSVMIKDEKGKIIKLRKGDDIFGGSLASLDASTGQAVFNYSSSFGNKTVILTLKK